MKRVVLSLGTITLVAAMVLARPARVSAHAEYDHSEPADGATVAVAPTIVKVWFTEEPQLRGSSLKVENAAGQQVDNKDVKLDPSDPDHKLMTVGLPANLPAGMYKVEWKTVSAEDGDEDEGDFSFTIRPAAAAAPAASAPASKPSAAQAAPAPQPAAQPSPGPRAAAQVPQALPRTGSAMPDAPWVWLGLGGVLLALGIVSLYRARKA